MTLFDLEELTAYWADHPPIHILVGAYLGVGKHRRQGKPSVPGSPRPAADSDLAALLAELGPGFGASDVHAGLAPVVLDFSELRRCQNRRPSAAKTASGENGNPRVLLPLRDHYDGH
jgi:hypothetical protein